MHGVSEAPKGDSPGVEFGQRPPWRHFMPVIYELRGKWLPTATWESISLTDVPSAVRTARFLAPGLPWEKWISSARPRRNILFCLERKAKQIAGDPRNRGLPLARTPIKRTKRPGSQKSAPHSGKISPARSSGDALRPAKRRRFRHTRPQWLEIQHADALSVGNICAKSGSPAAPPSPSGSRQSD